MASLSSWISALRPRTLFLALATAICGSGIAYSVGRFNIGVCILSILLATILQLLSNMANDLGDYEQGTDITGQRLGPVRTVQSGAISPQQMKKGMAVATAGAIIVGLTLVFIALQFVNIIYIIFFATLGLAAIWAALRYTRGKNPYGYRGLGDLFSFVFFGPVPVVGTYFLHTQSLDFRPWLPAIALGLLSAAVLNINNMRDLDNDKKSGKTTIPVRIGLVNAKRYHMALTLGSLACFVGYNIIYLPHWHQHLYIMVYIGFVKILTSVTKITENRKLDPYLKYTAINTFIVSVIFAIFINL